MFFFRVLTNIFETLNKYKWTLERRDKEKERKKGYR